MLPIDWLGGAKKVTLIEGWGGRKEAASSKWHDWSK